MATAMNELVSDPVQRRTSRHSGSDNSIAKERPVDKEAQILAKEVEKDEMEVEADRDRRHALYQKFRPFILGGLAALILGWWISATVLQATRHRW